MSTIPSFAGQIAAKGGQPYKILLDTALDTQFSFSTLPLAPGQSRQFQIPLNKDVSLYINGIVCDLDPATASRLRPTTFTPTAQLALFFNVFDSRNLTRWFLPDPQPVVLGAGMAASRTQYKPSAFHVPAGQDLNVEFVNRSPTLSLTADFTMTVTGVLAQVGGAIRQY